MDWGGVHAEDCVCRGFEWRRVGWREHICPTMCAGSALLHSKAWECGLIFLTIYEALFDTRSDWSRQIRGVCRLSVCFCPLAGASGCLSGENDSVSTEEFSSFQQKHSLQRAWKMEIKTSLVFFFPWRSKSSTWTIELKWKMSPGVFQIHIFNYKKLVLSMDYTVNTLRFFRWSNISEFWSNCCSNNGRIGLLCKVWPLQRPQNELLWFKCLWRKWSDLFFQKTFKSSDLSSTLKQKLPQNTR